MSKKAAPDVVTRDVYPQCKQHPNLDDTFIALSDLLTSAKGSALAPGDRANATIRTGRLLAEVRNVATNPHPKYEVFVSESNMGFWKTIMEGAPEGPYSEGTFLLYLHMEDDYPALPPKARFCTPIIQWVQTVAMTLSPWARTEWTNKKPKPEDVPVTSQVSGAISGKREVGG